ncbi:Sir2 silent information regulator family NAD-dependent deacetylase [bacterium]|nr:Sir2 silent information regulator family NAD-dependent deacetylase [bacterium]
MTSMQDYSNEINQLKEALKEAAAVIIGAGAGLSTSAGFTYSGQRFEEYFKDFIDKYHFQDMYSGGFYPFPSLEEFWGYWSRYIYINRYLDAPKKVYENLLQLIKDKNYFVLTTNVDHCFQKAGFSKERLFYTQGDYGLFQCSTPCHNKTYDNEKRIKEMVEKQSFMRIPTSLIPKCPHCGQPMTMNLRSDDRFVQDEGWYDAAQRYQSFINQYKDKKILFLELGVGSNTPVIIKYPFWKYTMDNPNAIYACINYGEAVAPKEIRSQSICINEDIGKVLTLVMR